MKTDFYKWDFPEAVKVNLPNEDELKRLVVKQQCCKEFGIKLSDILKKRGVTNIIDAKMVYAYLTRTHFNDTLHRIAIELELDHTSVINLLRRMDDSIWLKDYPSKRMRKLEQILFKP